MPDAAWAVSVHPQSCSRRSGNPPVLTSSNPLSTRHQRFACARLSQSYLPKSRSDFSATFTTIAFDDSSLRWLDNTADLPTSKGLPSSLVQLRSAVWTGVTRDTMPQADICSAANFRRGRDASYLAPPAQIRTCSFPAYGSHLGYPRQLCAAVCEPASVTRLCGAESGACAADSNSPLLFRFLRGTRSGWQLQYGCTLTFAQTCEQDHLPIREFKRIVMRRGLIRVNLPKAREPLEGLPVRQNAYTKRRLDFDICIERDLCAGKQANSNMRFADRGETARDRVIELGHHEFVLGFRGS